MIHTIQLKYILTLSELISLYNSYCEDHTDNAAEIRNSFNNFLSRYRRNTVAVFIIPTEIYGITYIKFVFNPDIPFYVFMYITVDCQCLIYSDLTFDLFEPSEESIKALCYAYSYRMIRLFPVLETDAFLLSPDSDEMSNLARIVFLPLANTRRIDFAYNLRSDETALTLDMVGKSYNDVRKIPEDFEDNNNLFAKSHSKKPSSVTKLYDKHLYYNYLKEVRPNLYVSDVLIDSSMNILRYEYQRNNLSRDWINNNFNRPTLIDDNFNSPLCFFNKPCIERLLNNEFNKHIGSGNWCKDYTMTKIINESDISPLKKRKMLKDIAPIISQSRSIKTAEKNYISGTYSVKGRIISGSKTTFRAYMSLFNQLGVNPMRIPDRYVSQYLRETGRTLNIIHNPINNIIPSPHYDYHNYLSRSPLSYRLKNINDYYIEHFFSIQNENCLNI
ncbi:hypothetical protein QUV50_09780 [Phascolarctobacterium faecium]|nr:hypothetical protein [Phascolarctobacterium faecium]MDM8112072.1 hypothetical protein [Phascolarctobacterium faecium]